MENNFIQMAASDNHAVAYTIGLIFNDNAIFKNRAQNIECSFGCVARSAVLLKSNVSYILRFNFCDQKFVQHGPITINIDCNDKCNNFACLHTRQDQN